MFLKRKNSLVLLMLFFLNSGFSQDLTGTWEGDLDNSEFLQVNIVQVNNNLCGYTWDYVYNNKRSFCKAYFTGYYDKRKKEWILTGSSFIANSGDHILMRLILTYEEFEGDKLLKGRESDSSPVLSILSLLFRQNVYLKKVSDKPDRMLESMIECLKEKQPKKDSVKIKPTDSLKKVIIPVTPVITKASDSIKKIKPPIAPKNSTTDSNQIFKQMIVRKNMEMKHLVVNDKNITLSVYDNGIVDNDTVSVFYNGILLLSHQRLSEKPIVIPISLDEKTTLHEITLFAENLGSIPPNTALVVVHAGDKRYELYASASLTENAVITFEYKPK